MDDVHSQSESERRSDCAFSLTATSEFRNAMGPSIVCCLGVFDLGSRARNTGLAKDDTCRDESAVIHGES